MRLPRGRAGTLAAAFGCGVVAALGQAPLGWWWAALAGLAGLVALIGRQGRPGRAFAVGLAGGAGHFLAALNWLVEPFLIDAARHAWMAPFALLLMALGLGLFWAAAAALSVRAPRPALAFALALTVAEALRGVVLTGFPWAQPGHVWIGTPVDQIAALAGPHGLLLLTLVVAALPATFGARGAGAAAALLAAAFAHGHWRLSKPLPADRAASLRLVQPAAEQLAKWDPARAREFFDRQIALTSAGVVADLTIWPETAVPYLLEYDPEVAGVIARASGGRPVAVGIQRAEGARFWNSLRLIEGQGEVTATYDKHHLVPFGEYIPLGDLMEDWFGLTAFAAQAGAGYSAGPGPVVLDLGPRLGRVLPLICYEAVFPGLVRAAPERPDWLLQVTNDAWFGTLTGPFQHAAQARLRAIEQGLPLIRVANTGVTAVIDARGRIVQALPFGTPGRLDAVLPGALAATPYARWGEAPALVLLACLLPLALRRRRAVDA